MMKGMGPRLTLRPSATTEDDSDDDPPRCGTVQYEAVNINIDLQVNPHPPLPTGNQLKTWLRDHLAKLAAHSGVSRGQLSVRLVDDVEMTRLHDLYIGDPTTTDVLTFDLRDDTTPSWTLGEPIEGDLAICLDEAMRQAKARGHDVRHEVLLYAVHGLLHLMGMDDDQPEAAETMHQREDELLLWAGVGPVYRH